MSFDSETGFDGTFEQPPEEAKPQGLPEQGASPELRITGEPLSEGDVGVNGVAAAIDAGTPSSTYETPNAYEAGGSSIIGSDTGVETAADRPHQPVPSAATEVATRPDMPEQEPVEEQDDSKPQLELIEKITIPRGKSEKEAARALRPVQGRINTAIRTGESMELIVSRKNPGAPLRVEATKPFKAYGASTNTGGESSGGRTATAVAEKEPQTKYWARIRGVPVIASAPEAPDAPPPQGIQMKALAEYEGEEDFEVHITARGVEQETHRKVVRDLGIATRNADQRTFGGDEEKARFGALHKELSEARANRTAETQILVCSTNKEALADMAEHVAREYLPTGKMSWEVVENEEKTDIKHYKTREEAIADGKKDPHSYGSAKRLTELIEYPDQPLSGMEVEEGYSFGAERRIKPGVDVVHFGRQVDNEGIDRGAFPVPIDDLAEHTLLIGGSGSGKTTAEVELMAAVTEAAWNRHLKDPSIPMVKVISFNAKKANETAQQVADAIAGTDVPDNMAVARVIRPGSKGTIRPTINPFSTIGTTPKEQAARSKMTLTIGIGGDSDTRRVNERYIGDGIYRAYRGVGYNLRTNESDYPNNPSDPTPVYVARSIRNNVSESDYEDKVKGNIGEFAAGPLEALENTIPGEAFRGGHPIDFTKMINEPGVEAFELDKMGNDPVSRRIAIMATLQEVEKAVDLEHGGQMTNHLRVLVVLGESGDLFDRSTTGAALAEYLAILRSKGIGIVISQQGGLPDVDRKVLENTRNVFALSVQDTDNREKLSSKLGVSTGHLDYLGTAEIKNGKGLARGKDMTLPVRFQATDLSKLRTGNGRVETSAAAIVDLGTYDREYSGETIERAMQWLTTDPMGLVTRSWGELNAWHMLKGRLLVPLLPSLKSHLEAMDPDDRDCALCITASASVAARKDSLYVAPLEVSTEYIREHMFDQVYEESPRVGPVRLDLCHDEGYYGQVEDAIQSARTAGRHDDTDQFIAGLQECQTTFMGEQAAALTEEPIRITGRIAKEQLNVVHNMMHTSLGALAAVVGTADGQPLDARAINYATAQLAKLVGSQPIDAGVEPVRIELARRRGGTLPDRQAAALDAVIERLRSQERPTAIGYPDILEALGTAIHKAETRTEKIDMTEFTKIYDGEEFGGNDLAEQERIVRNKQQARVAASDYQRKVSPDQLFVDDFIDPEGRLTLDSLVAKLVSKDQPQTRLVTDHRTQLNKGRKIQYTLGKMIERGEQAKWGNMLGRAVLLGPYLDVSPVVSTKIITEVEQHMALMSSDAAAQLERDRKRGVPATR